MTNEIYDLAREETLEGHDEIGRELMSIGFDRAPRPENMPLFDGVLVDGDSLIWLRRYDPGQEVRTWFVQDFAGELVATLEIPEALFLVSILGEQLLTKTVDAFDVQRIQLWRIQR